MDLDSIISLNIGISAILALISLQAYTNFKKTGFEYIFIGWVINTALLTIRMLSDEEARPPDLILLRDLANATSSFFLAFSCFAYRLKISERRLYLISGFVISLLIGWVFNHVHTLQKNLLFTFTSVLAICFLFFFFRNLNDPGYSKSRKLKFGISISLWGIVIYGLAHLVSTFSLLWFGDYERLDELAFWGAIAAKTIMIIGFYTYVLGLMENKVVLGNFADELSKIIGLTFHELNYLIRAFEERIAKLHSDPENYRLSKPAKRLIDEIEFEVHRLIAIHGASTQRYMNKSYAGIKFDENISKPELRRIGFIDEIFNVNKVLEAAHVIFKTKKSKIVKGSRLYNTNVKFHFQYGGGCNIRGNEIRLTQVFVNLFQNSFDAFVDKKGSIFVKTYVESNYSKEKGVKKHVVVEVEDTGSGIKYEDLERIFTENFTTKPWTNVTRGFGLSESKQIVEQEMGGAIRVESPVIKKRFSRREPNAGPGTKFVLRFIARGTMA